MFVVDVVDIVVPGVGVVRALGEVVVFLHEIGVEVHGIGVVGVPVVFSGSASKCTARHGRCRGVVVQLGTVPLPVGSSFSSPFFPVSSSLFFLSAWWPTQGTEACRGWCCGRKQAREKEVAPSMEKRCWNILFSRWKKNKRRLALVTCVFLWWNPERKRMEKREARGCFGWKKNRREEEEGGGGRGK